MAQRTYKHAWGIEYRCRGHRDDGTYEPVDKADVVLAGTFVEAWEILLDLGAKENWFHHELVSAKILHRNLVIA